MGRAIRMLVVAPIQTARRHGAGHGTAFHKDMPNLRFWWPGLGTRCLHGQRFDVVVVTMSIGRADREWLVAHCMDDRTMVVSGSVWDATDLLARDAGPGQ